jgi:uncharacterized protein (TIGR03086 family)
VTTQPLEEAIASTRGVLAGVTKQELGNDTPCAKWKVSDLINHIIGAQGFFTASVTGTPLDDGDSDFAATDYVSAFEEHTGRCLTAFQGDGVMERMLTLPFGTMPGSAFVMLAATDMFTHGWDLAKATGQDTDLAPELSATLLAGARQSIMPEFRSEGGDVFGPEKQAPAGASNADQLAAFLGRTV